MSFSPRLTLRRRLQLPTSGEGVPQQSSENDFFAKRLYDQVIKRLDHGYSNATAVVEYMQEERDVCQNLIKTLTSKSTKRVSRIKRHVNLSSYDTTRQILIDTIKAEKDISIEKTQVRITAIDEVIENFQKEIDKIYLKTVISFRRKHVESDRLRRLFDDQHLDLSRTIQNLESCREKQQSRQDAVDKLEKTCKDLRETEPVDQQKLKETEETLRQKNKKLKTSKKDVIDAEVAVIKAKEKYRQEFNQIYQKCRAWEEQALEVIQQVLLNFIQANHPSNLTDQEEQNYQNLLADIKLKHNINEDLDAWARNHGILPSNSLANTSQSNAITTDVAINPRTTDVAFTLADQIGTALSDRTSSC